MSSNKVIELLNKSYSQFHVVSNLFEEIEKISINKVTTNNITVFELPNMKKILVKSVNSSSFFAALLNKDKYYKFNGFRIVASHTDSPTFKIKNEAEITNAYYSSLNVEPYGGMIMYSFLDKPLSIAGRVFTREDDGTINTYLYHDDKDLLVIPSVAIHLNREVNRGMNFNAKVDTIPLVSTDSFNLIDYISKKIPNVIDFDLFLYNRQQASYVGANDEFIGSPRLDNLTSVYSSLDAMLKAAESEDESPYINILACFDNEEVGSLTRQGAASPILNDFLEYVYEYAVNDHNSPFKLCLERSVMFSVDNGHAVHPNHPEYADRNNQCYVNSGIMIKYNASQKYTSDALSSLVVKTLCEENGLNYQIYTNRSDLPGGSTLGNLSQAQAPIITVDIGLPQLAMHSSYELCGKNDYEDMEKLLHHFFKSDLTRFVKNSNVVLENYKE